VFCSSCGAQAVIYRVAAFACVRFGLVTLAVAVFAVGLLLDVSISFDFSRWYASTALLVPLVVLALAAWSFHTALRGQKLSKEDLLD
jgi:protein-S-isoprenylcysteine O-methyltransferase Ste14